MGKRSHKEKRVDAEFPQESIKKLPHQLALFFMFAYGAGLAVFLARFFSLTFWQHYGAALLILSFTGIAAASAVLYLFASFFQRNHSFFRFWLPFILLFVSGMAFHLLARSSFDLQQFWLIPIGLVLFSVFFLIGLYCGMSWADQGENARKVCALSFLGGGMGVLFILITGIWLDTFYLPAALIILVSLSALCQLFVMPYGSFLAILSFLVFLTGFVEWRVVESGKKAAINSQRLALSIEGAEEGKTLSSLDALPYLLRPAGQYALFGTQGGYKIRSLWKEQRVFWAVEPMKHQFEKARKNLAGMAEIHLIRNTPLSLMEKHKFDLIDIDFSFLEQEAAHRYAVTVEAFSQNLVSLQEGGILSVPVKIDDFPEYGARMAATIYQALERNKVPPPQHIVVYRSPQEMRILASPTVFAEEDIETIKAFCRNNKLDLVWYPGFSEEEETEKQGDALIQGIVQGSKTLSDTKFNIAPATWDRPFHGIIPLTALPHFLGKLDVLPLTEQGLIIQVMTFFLILVLGGVILFSFLKKAKTASAFLPYFAVHGMAFALA
ncbi:MAG: hypothetical protein LBV07_01135, partial [Syntrophobacterales bacterium]|nr:hypothetical protein [Syntrophobacterales bacterium]